jgi:S-adenosylmethionine-diacylglycerol 3-amino-3-carboxypropyl transferase
VNYSSKLLYNQTWEDPRADLHALNLNADCRAVAIASAGCNLLNYLVADCGRIDGVDINATHLEVAKLRITAMKYLPDHASFFRFFGEANKAENVDAYEHYLLPQLDADAKLFWERKDILGRRRIDYFKRGFYRQGLCGQSFRSQVILARLFGRVYERMLACTNLQEQENCFDQEIEPGYKIPFLGALCEHAWVFVPLGIPPAQLERVRWEDSRPMLEIIRQRVRGDYKLDARRFSGKSAEWVNPFGTFFRNISRRNGP